ncbi:hypothetical protein [Chitinimonas sp. BJB300]|uniref:hypothetical protein n=1 Tax=Chitinimonas sp. BJB300 TaxID=1559339 RepID=UPI0011122F0F|nr:hypothetical protein [Chitinimonas sp. BJB300]TSJ91450.1 hypothetical protein FG002_004010 [Chitinimonas sp. BJB300]
MPPERAAIRMVVGPRMLQSFAGSWAFLDKDTESVEARFRYQLKATPAWMWLEWLMRWYFSWETRRRLHALKRYLESTADDHVN